MLLESGIISSPDEGPVELCALVHTSFHEDRQESYPCLPWSLAGALDKKVAVAPRVRVKPNVVVCEKASLETQSCHHPKEELRVRRGPGKPSRLLLIQIFGQRSSDVLDRGSDTKNTSQEDGKVTDIDQILVPEVHEQLVAGQPGSR